MAQFPIRKTTTIRTVKNVMADGSMLVAADPGAGTLVWTLTYINLAPDDTQALQSHFSACGGPYRGFTFLDPTDNLLTYSADLTQAIWLAGAPVMSIRSGLADPEGGAGAFAVTNPSGANVQLSQTILAPVNFQYCFSIYAASAGPAKCTLLLSGANAVQSNTFAIGSSWGRIFSSGALNDSGSGLTVGVTLEPAQTLYLYGPQLEPQIAPSRYRSTYSNSGLYQNAHWAVPELIFTADGPNLFSTSFTIETSTAT